MKTIRKRLMMLYKKLAKNLSKVSKKKKNWKRIKKPTKVNIITNSEKVSTLSYLTCFSFVEIVESTTQQNKNKDALNYLARKGQEEEDYKHEKDLIETDMLKMAKGMKEFANSFKT